MKLNLKKDWWTGLFICSIIGFFLGLIIIIPKITSQNTLLYVIVFAFSLLLTIGIYKRSKLAFWIMFIVMILSVISTMMLLFANKLDLKSTNIVTYITNIVNDFFVFMVFLQILRERKKK